MKTYGAAWLLSLAMLLPACGEAPLPEPILEETPQATATQEATAEPDEFLARLRSIPGLTVISERPAPIPGTRWFLLSLDLPVDHARPRGEHFPLRLLLMHRSVDAPMVLASEGYMLTGLFETEPAALLGANQLLVEHRFLGASRPASNDLRFLNLQQAAGDAHRVIESFKPLYSGHWLTTGGSKGGLAAVFHRYFYPDDVDATVAYVAPASHGLRDVRYVHFLEQVGDAACRAKLEAFQQDVLRRREELRPLVEARGTALGTGFEVVGGADRALEFSAVETSFYFWQYGPASGCAAIPAPGAPAAEAFAFMDGVVGVVYTYGDRFIAPIAPAYYQAATQLGWPRFPLRHLRGLLRYPGENTPDVYLDFPVTEPFDWDAMLRVEHWVRGRGERMLFIYGENDPWSAAAFSVRERNDAFRFFVPGGNHGANLQGLPEPERTFAVERLFTWMGLSAPSAQGRARALELAAGAEASRPAPPRFRR